MVCCVIVAMMFALPFIVVRGIRGVFNGSQCSMAWRPAVLPVSTDRSLSNDEIQGNLTSQRMDIDPHSGNTVNSGRAFTFVDRVKSFGHAGRGAVRLLRFEHSAWIQLSLASVAILLAIVLNITLEDWRWIVIACGLVLSLEGLNTAVERTCDRISVAYCSQIKVAKDVAAGAVLLGSIAAALIGFLTFLPYITAFGGTENKVAASNTSLAALSATDSDYSRFLVFHCLNPQQNERSTSDRVASAASGKPGV